MADDVEIKFGADTGDVEKGTSKVTDDVQGLEATIQQLVGTLQTLSVQFPAAMEAGAAATEHVAQEMDIAEAAMGHIKDRIVEVGEFMAAAFAIEKIAEWTASTAAAAQEIQNLSSRLGIAVEDLAALKNITGDMGLSDEAVTKGIQGMSRALLQARDGSKETGELFQALGVDINDNTDTLTQFFNIAQKFSEMPEGLDRTSLAMKVLGRSGAELLPFFDQGLTTIKEKIDETKASGESWSESQVNAGIQVNASIKEMEDQASALGRELFTTLAPAILAIINGLKSLVEDFRTAETGGGALGISLGILEDTLGILAVVAGGAGVALADVLTVAVDTGVIAVGTLEAVVMALCKAMSGDFQGAADAFTGKLKQVGDALADNDKKLTQVHENYDKYVKDVVNGAAVQPPAPKNQGTAAGADILQQLRDQQAAQRAEKEAEEAAKKQAALDAEVKKHEEAWQKIAAVEIDALKGSQEAEKNDFQAWDDLQDQKIQIAAAAYGTDSKEYQNLLNEKQKATISYNQMLERMAIDAANSARVVQQGEEGEAFAAANAKIDIARTENEELTALGQQTRARELANATELDAETTALQQQHEEKIFQLKLASLEEQLTLSSLTVEQQQKIHVQIETLEQQHQAKLSEIIRTGNAALVKDQNAAANDVVSNWEKITQPLASNLGNVFTNLVTHAQTFRQSMQQMGNQLLTTFVNMGAQMVAKWAAQQIAMTVAHTAAKATQVATETTAAATTNTITAGSALAQIINFAWTAAAGAFSALAGIPYVGPFLAVAAAAAAVGAVLGFAGNIASAAGGWERVPYDGAMTELHKDEMVLPSRIANPLRSAISGWSPSVSPGPLQRATGTAVAQYQDSTRNETNGGDSHLHYAPTLISQNQSLRQQLRTQATQMKKWVSNKQRNGEA